MKNIKEFVIDNVNPNKIGICLGIIIFIVTILGVTYAYVEPTFYNNEVIGFSAIENTEDVNKIKITDDTSLMRDFLIPINEEDIYTAVNRENICVDDNGHYVCSLYQFTIENTWEATQKLSLSLFTESNNYGNYYFMLFKGKKTNLSKANQIVESTHLTQDLINKDYTFPNVEPLLEPGQKVTYTILFYVKAIEASQTALDRGKTYTGHINVNSISTGYTEDDEFKDISREPNSPDIENTGLVPVKYNGSKWVITTSTDSEWYDYDNQKWANAVSLAEGVSTKVGTELTLPTGDSTDSDVLAMFVWIPRFSYTIGCTNSSTCLGYKIEGASDLAIATPGAIDIKFVDTDTKEDPGIANGTYPTYIYTSDERTPSNWYTHPAFDFGGEPLSGIWVGKFETSVDTTSTCYSNLSVNSTSASSNCVASNTTVMPRILPNVLALTYQTIYNQFNTANKFTATDNIYGLIGDAHMMKNSEWSAVAYLSQSIYGKYGNASYTLTNKEIYKNDSGRYVSSSYWGGYTGRSQRLATATSSYSTSGTCYYDDITDRADGTGACGAGASTTGNIYGIYDMSGGAYDRVMGNYGGNIGSAGFSSMPDTKYYDKFTTTSPFATKQADTIGYAFVEVSGWYNDTTSSSYSASYPWVSRGGYYNNFYNAGAFYGSGSDGNASTDNSFRVCLATLP